MAPEGHSVRQKVFTSFRALERFSAKEPYSRVITFLLMVLNNLEEGHWKTGEKSENIINGIQ